MEDVRRCRWTGAVVVGVLALALTPLWMKEADAQEIPEAVLCEECAITFEAEVDLGGLDAPASPGPTAHVASLTDGRFAVSSPMMGPAFHIYGADGTHEKEVGRSGEGPGEFGGPPLLDSDRGEAVVTLDPWLGRATWFSLDGDVMDEAQLGFRGMDLRAHEGRAWVSGVPSQGEGGEAVHIVEPEDGVTHSFGALDAQMPPQAVMHRVAVTEADTIWTMAALSRSLEQRGPEGERVREYVLGEDHVPMADPREVGPGAPPSAQVTGLQVDGEGRVWIYVALMREDIAMIPGEEPPSPEEMANTTILVFDPDEERVVARDEVGAGFIQPMDGGWAYTVVETEIGDREVRVGQVILEDTP